MSSNLNSRHRHNRYPTNQYQGHESLEESNLQREGELKDKVSALKSLTIQIGEEARLQTELARNVDDQFDSASALLQNGINKVLALVRSPSRHHLLYLALFAFFVFFVIWWIK